MKPIRQTKCNNVLPLAIFLAYFFLSGNLFAQITSYPYSEDFEGEGQCPTGCGANCGLTGQWQNVNTDNLDWLSDFGGTGSFNTGPTIDHSSGSMNGIYLYVESSCNGTGYPGKNAELISPIFDFSTLMSPKLEFWYHMFGTSMGTMHLDISTDGGTLWTTDIIPSWTDNQDLWQLQSIVLLAYAGMSNVRFRIRGITGSSFGSDMAIDDIVITDLVPDDAGVISIDMPTSPYVAGPNNVQVTIENFGTNIINNLNIYLEINGMVQSPVVYNTPIAIGSTTGPIGLGSFNFPTGITIIRAWTSDPNGMPDQQMGNDTLTITGCDKLNGVYTVGGGFPDIESLAIAIDLLNECGVSGPVIFNLAPGVHTAGAGIDPVIGGSATNTVTFDGNSTVLTTVESGNTNEIFFLNGADHITITNLTLEHSGTMDAFGVRLANMADSNTVRNCVINLSNESNLVDVIGISHSATTTSSFSEGNNGNYNLYENNTINGGEKSIHLEGQNGNRNLYNRIINNRLIAPEDYGIYIDDQDSLRIVGNVIQEIRVINGDGIYCFDIMDFEITGNKVNAPDWGIYVADGNFPPDGVFLDRGKVINNMVKSETDYAMYFDDFENADIFHNTVYGNPGMRINDFTGLDIRNNIFRSDQDYAFESDESVSAQMVNYNIYFTPASNALFVKDGPTTYANLPTWQAGVPALNTNSAEIDPFFVSPQDLHILSPAANDLGDNSVGVTVDCDGDSRPISPSTTVDIGADEYNPSNYDARVCEIIKTISGCGQTNDSVFVSVQNLGALTLTSIPVQVDVLASINQTLMNTWTGSIDFGEKDTFMVGLLNTTAGGIFNMSAWSELPGEQNIVNDTAFANCIAQPIIAPSAIAVLPCDGGLSYLLADGFGVIGWFDSLTGGTELAMGDTFYVDIVSSDTTFYVGYSQSIMGALTTTFAGGNGCGSGNMFNITTINAININAFEVNTSVAAGSMVTVTVHYIPNSNFDGNEGNAGAWTTLGSATVVSSGGGMATLVDLPDLLIPAGATYAMYVEYPANYTNGAMMFSNTDLMIETGLGLCSSFGGFNNPRTFNGTIIYGTNSCTDERTPIRIINGNSLTRLTDLSCQDNVHISLGSDCTYDLSIADVLYLGNEGCTNHLEIKLAYPAGTDQMSPPNQLNHTHRGHEIIYSVRDNLTGNSCWGTVLVEEKYPPQIICRNDTISCLHMGERADLVITSDNCTDIKPQIDILEKVWTDLGCDDREFIGYLSRRVRATDLWGNYQECRDTLWVWKEVLDSLVCPEDTALACNLQHGNVDVLWKTGAKGYTYLDAEGYAHPWPTDAGGIAPAPYLKSIDPDQADGYMIPMKTDAGPVFDNGGKCHIVFKYKDHIIPTCGNAYKIRREWIISDWCAKTDTTCIQWIKITDELPPVIDNRYFVPDNDLDLGPWLIEDHDLKASVEAHDCKAHVGLEDIRNLVERRTGIAHPEGGWAKECDDDLKLYYEIEYSDPGHPVKKVVIHENYDDKAYVLFACRLLCDNLETTRSMLE